MEGNLGPESTQPKVVKLDMARVHARAHSPAPARFRMTAGAVMPSSEVHVGRDVGIKGWPSGSSPDAAEPDK